MGRRVVVLVLVCWLVAACSGGGSKAAAPTPTTSVATASTTTTTTAATSPEDQVKQAYLAYWTMVDRLLAAPNPDDAELPLRAADPMLGFLKDDLSTRAAQGRTTELPSDPSRNSHTVQAVVIGADSAAVTDCFVDGRIAHFPDGTRNDNVVTKLTKAEMINIDGRWLTKNVQVSDQFDGVTGCAPSS